MEPGMRVRAKRDVYSLVRIAVPCGTPGTVEEIRDYGTIVVRFDNGHRLGMCDSFLAPQAEGRNGGLAATVGSAWPVRTSESLSDN
jgi:hypothetical protein